MRARGGYARETRGYCRKALYLCRDQELASFLHLGWRTPVVRRVLVYLVLRTAEFHIHATHPSSWLLMRYPVSKSLRAKLIHLYYELCLLPGIEPRITRSWADMLSRLLASKSDSRRKLEPQDLQLPWKPLWKVLQKELWIKSNLYESSSVALYLIPSLCAENSLLSCKDAM